MKLYDLIIMDLQMPIHSCANTHVILDGYESCKKITRLYEENNGRLSQHSSAKNSHERQEGLPSMVSEYSGEGEMMKLLKPVIIACTSHITEEIKQKIF